MKCLTVKDVPSDGIAKALDYLEFILPYADMEKALKHNSKVDIKLQYGVAKAELYVTVRYLKEHDG